MDKIELIIDDKHDVWHVKTKVELTFDNIEYLKSIPNGNENDNLGNLPSVSPKSQV